MQGTAAVRRGAGLERIGLTGPALDTFCDDVGVSRDYVLDLFDRLIITIAAWKGGVGKTELAKELAWLLDGVLVDLDWDAGGATRAWGYRHETRTNAPLLDALERGRCPRPLSGRGMRADLIPSHPDFAVNQPSGPDMAAALEKWSAELKRPLIIDTHPGGVPSTVGAASAAHVVVVPVNLETRALAATEQMANELQGGYPLLLVPNRVEAAPEAEVSRLEKISTTYSIEVGPPVRNHPFLKRRKLSGAVCAPGKSGQVPASSAKFVAEVNDVARTVLTHAVQNAIAQHQQDEEGLL